MKIAIYTSKSGNQSGGGGQKYNILLEQSLMHHHSVTRYHNLPETDRLETSRINNIHIGKRGTKYFANMLNKMYDENDLVIISTGFPIKLNKVLQSKTIYVSHFSYDVNFIDKAVSLILKKIMTNFSKLVFKGSKRPLFFNNVVTFSNLGHVYGKKKYWSIPNGVTLEEEINYLDVKDKVNKIIYIGRVVEKQKKFYSRLVAISKSLDMEIDAYGPLEEQGEMKSINYLGYCNNPIETLKKYKYSILLSEYEGFPIAISESISVGTPVIFTKSFDDAQSLSVNGDNLLLNNEKPDADVINNFMQMTDSDYTNKQKRLIEFAKKELTKEKFLARWKALVDEFEK